MDSTIILVFVFAWVISCLFYLRKISRIAHGSRVSVFSPLNKYHHTIRGAVKRLHRRILVVTLVFIIAVFIIFFVKSSS